MINSIAASIIWEGRSKGTTWFHPRACVIPHRDGVISLMTMQSISGSDVFGPVHWSISTDKGHTWSPPEKIPGLGKHNYPNDLQEGVCDVVPDFHTQTDTALAIGHNVYYRDGVLTKPSTDRYPVYVVRTANGHWLPRQKLAWHNKDEPTLYTCGCAQRINLPNGSILIPMSVGFTPGEPRVVCSVRCRFDGVRLKMTEMGNALNLNVGRGLLEPSLASFNGKFYMTIRAEDDHGYASVSDNGLLWEDKQPWCWDDGIPLTMSTTQQRWIANKQGLFLVYTRKAEDNVNVMRWRAPLYIAQVDPQTLRLIRSSEKVVFPIIGDGVNNSDHVARMGNFHTVNVSENESWVTTGETLPSDGWKGNTLLARIKWAT